MSKCEKNVCLLKNCKAGMQKRYKNSSFCVIIIAKTEMQHVIFLVLFHFQNDTPRAIE